METTKTQRFLASFAAVELQTEHRNRGDEGPALRDLNVAPSIATALIRWGEQHDLVCTFENKHGRSNNTYSWEPCFLRAAALKHIELWGSDLASRDLPAEYLRRYGPSAETSAYELERTARLRAEQAGLDRPRER